jgi:hypothetical protein
VRVLVRVALALTVGLGWGSSIVTFCFFVRVAFAFSAGAFAGALRTGFFRKERSFSATTSGTDWAPLLVETILRTTGRVLFVVDV